MGNFYTNITLKTGDQDAVLKFLRSSKRETFVSKSVSGFVVVCDAETESQNDKLLCKLAGGLSQHFEGAALAVLNHDDDILCYYLFDQGRELDRYDSNPGYFKGKPKPPQGGDSSLLMHTLGANCSASDLDAILHAAEPAPTEAQMATLEKIQNDFAAYQQQINELLGKHPSLLQNPTGPGGAELKEIQEKIQKEIVSQYPGLATTGKYTFAVERHQDLVSALGLPEYAVGTGYNYLKEGEAPIEDFEHT